MAQLTLELDISQVNSAITQALETDKRKLMGSLGAVMKRRTALSFRNESSPQGVPWIPSKRAQKQGGQTLTDTGTLRRSINYQVKSDTQVEIGTNVPYGAIHQYGFKGSINIPAHSRKGGISVSAHTRNLNMPARPFIGFGDKAIKEIEKAINLWADGYTK